MKNLIYRIAKWYRTKKLTEKNKGKRIKVKSRS